jgi:hypothetical protein
VSKYRNFSEKLIANDLEQSYNDVTEGKVTNPISNGFTEKNCKKLNSE